MCELTYLRLNIIKLALQVSELLVGDRSFLGSHSCGGKGRKIFNGLVGERNSVS
jgi:hypothetical protein